MRSMRERSVSLAFAALRAGARLPSRGTLALVDQLCATRDAVARHGIEVVVDVGANRGFWAQHLRRAGYRGEIYSFEPEPSAYAELRRRAAGDERWHVADVALGEENGHRELNVIDSGGETVLSSFLTASRPSVTAGTRTVQRVVEVRRLADVLEEAGVRSSRIFLKMDTQGFDHQVLAGLPDRSRVALLQSEVSVVPLYDDMVTYTDSLRAYAEMGFALLDLFPVNRTGHGEVAEYDCLMART